MTTMKRARPKLVYVGSARMLDGLSPIGVRFSFVVNFLLSIRDLLNTLDFQYWFAAVTARSSCDGITCLCQQCRSTL
jgi:hypothetical protein